MHRPWMLAVGLVGAAAIVGTGSAEAADRPLLVVVESQPGLGVDAAAVRQRISSELGQPVASPRDPTAAEASDLLVVALDGTEISISLRQGATTRVSRIIPEAPDRAGRLRAIAWLAGNLARDQVSPILPLPAPASAVARAPAPAQQDILPPATERTPIEPPPLAPIAPPPASMPSVATRGGTESAAPQASWMVTAAGGLTATRPCADVACRVAQGTLYDTSYVLELQHQIRPGGLIFGGAVDAGPTTHLMGLVGFVGSRWQGRFWFAEANVGAGMLTDRLRGATTTVTNSSVTGTSSETTVTTQVQPALYARAVGAIGFPISHDLDLVARLGVHLASTGLASDFLSATAGVRLKLP